MFEEELEFFISNQEELVKKYKGKVLVLKGNSVVGAYNSPLEAYEEGKKKYQLGTFMVQPCEPGPGAYTAQITFTSLVTYQ